MCLYPRLIKNKRYLATKKNKGIIPELKDERHYWVPIPCGNCIECRKQKANYWRIRLLQELKKEYNFYFVALTFSEEELKKLEEEVQYEESNAIATIAVKRFRERYRKQNKKSIRHFLITELGHEGTERIHLHGLLMTEKNQILDNDTLKKYWKYGNVFIGTYVNRKSINYIMKYITKIDIQHKGYQQIILVSPGIGDNYLNTQDIRRNQFNGKDTITTIKINGYEQGLPTYYKMKIYNEDEREELWTNVLDQEKRYVLGEKISIATEDGMKQYEETRDEAQKINIRCGYGDDSKEWKKKKYNTTNRKLKVITAYYKNKKNNNN